jgi:riboflavin-specific deaminase-like protein
VFLNLAITADGKINTASRSVSSFGSKRDRENMLELRATADALVSGARTVDLNPVSMGTGPEKYRRLRLKGGLGEHALRVIVSGSGSVEPKAEIFKQRFSPILIVTSKRALPGRLAALRKVADEVKVCGDKEVNIRQALRWLSRDWKVKRLLCEGGGELDDAFFRAGVVDEIHLTICPKIFGGRDAPTIADGIGLGKLAKARQFELKSFQRVADEVFLIYRSVQRAQSQSKSESRLR